MPTSSFDRKFVVTDPETIKRFRHALANPIKVKIRRRDREKESKDALELLKAKLGQ